MENFNKVFDSLSEVLDHVKRVESEVSDLSLNAMTTINKTVLKEKIHIDDQCYMALQHQDILKQQLSATFELLESTQRHLIESLEMDEVKCQNLDLKLQGSLEIAKDKKRRFSGNAFMKENEEAIEFF